MSLADPNIWYYTGLWKITTIVSSTVHNIYFCWKIVNYNIFSKNTFRKVLNVSDRIQIAIGFYIEFYRGQERRETILNNWDFRKEFFVTWIKVVSYKTILLYRDRTFKFYIVKICKVGVTKLWTEVLFC